MHKITTHYPNNSSA